MMIGINAIDVTEHLETKARLEHLLASGPAAIYTCEAEGNFAPTYISDNVKGLVGWEPRHFLENPRFWIKHVHPEDRRRVLKRLELPWPEDHQTFEYRFLAKDGAYRWMHDEVKLVRDQDGKPVEIAGRLDGHHGAPSRPKRRSKKVKTNTGCWSIKSRPWSLKDMQDWSIDFFDDKIEDVTGYRKEEFDSRRLKWCDLILPEDLDMVQRDIY